MSGVIVSSSLSFVPDSQSLTSVKFQLTRFLSREPLTAPRKPPVLRLLEFNRVVQPHNINKATAAAVDAAQDALLADVKVETTNEPNSSVRISVSVPPSVCQHCYERVLLEYGKKIKVPGFRPGKKVPEKILVNYVGKQNVKNATIESVLKDTLQKAVSSVNGRALEDSARIATKFSEIDATFSSEGFIRYDVLVDVSPEIKWTTPDAYKNLKVIIEIDEEIKAQKTCDLELRRRYKASGPLRIVNDRGLQIGDVAILDIYAKTTGSGETGGQSIPSAESKGFHLDTEECTELLPGFLDSIVGLKGGDQKSFILVFPNSWKQESLRAIEAQFTVECKELFYRDLPPLDDALSDKLLPGCSTLDQVREFLLKECQEVEQVAVEQATDNALLDELTKIVAVDIPQSLFEEQGRQLYGAHLLQLQVSKKLNEQQLLSLSSENAVREYLNNQKVNITKLVKQALVVGEIFKRENLQFSLEELEKEVVNTMEEFKSHNQEYEEKRIREQVQGLLEGAKVLEWLKQHAEIQYVTK